MDSETKNWIHAPLNEEDLETKNRVRFLGLLSALGGYILSQPEVEGVREVGR